MMSAKPKLNPKKILSELKESKIKMDYSGTYTENDHLDEALEGRLLNIHKAKYKASRDWDETLRQAKKTADREMYLRDCIRRWHLRNEQEHANSKRTRQKRPQTVHSVNFRLPNRQAYAADESTSGYVDDTGKLFNPLTMFAVSLQKSDSGHFSQTEINDLDDETQSRRRKSVCIATPTPEMTRVRSKSRPQTAAVTELTSSQTRGKSDMYGIHIEKRSSRSMRKLQDEFTLNLNKLGDIFDVYEQRRKSLILTETEDSDLPNRINAFLEDIDDFTGKSRKNTKNDHIHRKREKVY